MTTRLEKPLRRVVELRGRLYVVELTRSGIRFREHGKRFAVEATWGDALNLAEHRAGELAHQDRLRTAALKRIAR